MVSTNHDSDFGLRPALEWIAYEMPDFDPVDAKFEKITGGQSNPTFRLRTKSGHYVLRRKPGGNMLASAHAVDREFRVQKALEATGVPVARMHVLCEDINVIGASFYLMDEVKGRNLTDPGLPDIPVAERRRYLDEMAHALAAVHKVDPEEVGLADYAPPGNYMRRQIDRWSRQYRASETEQLPDMEKLMAHLGAEVFAEDAPRHLVHGDYRIDNLLFDTNDARCVAILDWELSTLGDPIADLAALLMQWQMPAGEMGRGLEGVDRAAEGLLSDEEFISAYCGYRGISDVPRMNVYMAFAFFRMASILQGVKKRALDGNASDPERGLKIAKAIPVYAAKGLRALG